MIDILPRFSWIPDELFPDLEHLTVFAVMSPGLPTRYLLGSARRSFPSTTSAPLHLHTSSTTWRTSMLQQVTMRQLIVILSVPPHPETLSLGVVGSEVSLHDDKPSKTRCHLKYLALVAPASKTVPTMDQSNFPSTTSLTLDLSGLPLPSLLPNDILTNRLFKVTPNFPHFTRLGTVKMGGLQFVRSATERWGETFLVMYPTFRDRSRNNRGRARRREFARISSFTTSKTTGQMNCGVHCYLTRVFSPLPAFRSSDLSPWRQNI